MDLRELTRATAIEMGWSLLYEDVDAVLHSASERGEVAVQQEANDYRERVWRAA